MFSTIALDQDASDSLRKYCDIWINPTQIRLTDESIIEQPSAPIQGITSGPDGTFFGAYSYSWTPIGQHVKSVGRYCSIGGWVIFGDHEHPTDWLTTSNIPWDHNFITGAFAKRSNPDLPIRPYKSTLGAISIGHDVWVGSRSYIKRGVSIGNGAIIGANAVVTKDVPPFGIVTGNPGRVRRFRFDEETIQLIQECAWWQYDFADIGTLDFADPVAACKAIIRRAESGDLIPYAANQMNAAGLKDALAT
uniref:CatB-related O-acetyltransferase n=1 Tax=uncultured Rhizobium sp. TaxID=155567 RepID=UPI0026235034|nr:CatB-related O-acetyltransferase [uncultured Rhizobium sp.]